ncbi:MAG: zinc dependent phospholipase C family protein [Eubacteriales bacterium]|nr:zinc dependent phospholipase C family protein [Eubacteriales bacterium]MDD3199361.1 zinc dependent phospholipase C family protein [Eubacteriales bacterium]MDD4629221.1 zinc dependent phospholipase C family protein [Eubacteriales bacterium]
MPTTYAHYTFGMKVYDLLNKDAKSVIDKHKSLFLVGLHGPDILFYYKPLKSNDVANLGRAIHRQTALVFYKKAKEQLAICPDKSAGISYLLGFFCHFMLDSECHPLVRYKTKTEGLTHNKIEKEFDRLMMKREGLDPNSYKPTQHLILNAGDEKIIACFYPEMTTQQIGKSVKDMKKYLDFLVSPGKAKHSAIRYALKIFAPDKGFGGLLMNREPLIEYVKSSEDLADLLLLAVKPTARYAGILFQGLYGGINTERDEEELKQRMNRDFG